MYAETYAYVYAYIYMCVCIYIIFSKSRINQSALGTKNDTRLMGRQFLGDARLQRRKKRTLEGARKMEISTKFERSWNYMILTIQ